MAPSTPRWNRSREWSTPRGWPTADTLAYVRAQDANGSWGPVSAAFVWILDPATAAHVAGAVTSADGGTPLAATVATGIFATQSDPTTGEYDLMLPAGTYDITATADGYGSQTAAAVAALAGAVSPLDFVLTPYEIVLDDAVETGNLGWTAEGLWAITDEASASPDHSWTDSPGGEYGDYWDFSLISPDLDFSRCRRRHPRVLPHLRSRERLRLRPRRVLHRRRRDLVDRGVVQRHRPSRVWESVEIDLGALDHVADARIRFRIDTDVSVTEDGWHIDDIVIRGFDEPPPGLIFRDDFETGDTSSWDTVAP